MSSLYVALVHYPVLNRRGETIASAITNLDLHDLARLACTYGLPVCYIVTPLKDQQRLAGELIGHWCEGVGKTLHPDRAAALERLRVVESIAARADIEHCTGIKPKLWATTAKPVGSNQLSHSAAQRQLMESVVPHLLLLGTGWGLAPSVLDVVDAVLEPISGFDGYNHLSVRSAASILIDRLLYRGRE